MGAAGLVGATGLALRLIGEARAGARLLAAVAAVLVGLDLREERDFLRKYGRSRMRVRRSAR